MEDKPTFISFTEPFDRNGDSPMDMVSHERKVDSNKSCKTLLIFYFQIYDLYRWSGLQHLEGLHINAALALMRSKGVDMSIHEFMGHVRTLCNEGWLFSTIDDEHYDVTSTVDGLAGSLYYRIKSDAPRITDMVSTQKWFWLRVYGVSCPLSQVYEIYSHSAISNPYGWHVSAARAALRGKGVDLREDEFMNHVQQLCDEQRLHSTINGFHHAASGQSINTIRSRYFRVDPDVGLTCEPTSKLVVTPERGVVDDKDNTLSQMTDGEVGSLYFRIKSRVEKVTKMVRLRNGIVSLRICVNLVLPLSP